MDRRLFTKNVNRYVCAKCSDAFYMRQDVQRHTLHCDGHKATYPCKPCRRRFSTHALYHQHMRDEHSRKRA